MLSGGCGQCGFLTTCIAYIASHLDHCAAVIAHARRRLLLHYDIAKYYMPRCMLPAMKMAIEAFESLNGSPIPMQLVGMDPNEETSVGHQCTVLAFRTEHCMTSQGYIVYRTIKRGLKKEYVGLEGHQLKALKSEGVSICNIENRIELAFTGDTKIEPLLCEPRVHEVRVVSKLFLSAQYYNTLPSTSLFRPVFWSWMPHTLMGKWILEIDCSTSTHTSMI